MGHEQISRGENSQPRRDRGEDEGLVRPSQSGASSMARPSQRSTANLAPKGDMASASSVRSAQSASSGATDFLGDLDSAMSEAGVAKRGLGNAEARAAKNRRTGIAGRQADRQNRDSRTALSGNDLAGKEESAASDTLGKGFTGNGVTATSSKRSDAKSVFKSLMKHKGLVVGAAGGSVGVIGIIVLLFVLASSLQIPNLAQNITNYEFARMSRQFAKSISRTTSEALAVQATDAADSSSEKTVVRKMLDKYHSYNPNKVMSNLQTNGKVKFNYGKTDLLGRPVLTSITLDGAEYEIKQQGSSRFIPGLASIIKFKNGVTYAGKFQPAMRTTLRMNDVNLPVRGVLAKRFRQELGINLVAWNLAKFKGKSGFAAQTEEAEGRAKKINDSTSKTTNNAVTENLKEGVDATKELEEAAADSDKEAQAALKNGGVVQAAQDAAAASVKKSGLDTVTGFINPAAGIGMAACIVYDGSLNNSGSTIDQQTTQAVASYHYIASAADQQKRGSLTADAATATELAAAVNATNTSLQSTTVPNALIRGGGGTVDTSTTLSPEQSAGGQFTLLDATIGELGIPGAGAIAGTINAIADKVCPIVTSTEFAIGGGLVNIGGAIISLGSSAAAEEAAGEAANQIIAAEAKSLAESLVTKYIGKTAGRVTGILYDTGKGTVKSGIKVAGATLLAKLVVNARAGQFYSGFSMGNDLATNADVGGTLTSTELQRIQMFGRPLLKNEVCASNQQDRTYLASNFASQSAYDRYLNVNVADSLLSRTAMAVHANLNGSMGRSLLGIGEKLLQPLNSFGVLTGMFTGVSHAAAGCNSDTTNYGTVQFAMSEDEDALIDSSSSYRPIENQRILANSGKEDDIAKKYAVCFGYAYNENGDGSQDPTDDGGNLVLNNGPEDDGSIGSVLSGGLIVRDSHGNVINSGSPSSPPDGLCSPRNLSYNSGDSLANDSATPKHPNDLIFRWRLARQYDATNAQEITGLQDAGKST